MSAITLANPDAIKGARTSNRGLALADELKDTVTGFIIERALDEARAAIVPSLPGAKFGLLPADWAGDVDEPTMDFGERRD